MSKEQKLRKKLRSARAERERFRAEVKRLEAEVSCLKAEAAGRVPWVLPYPPHPHPDTVPYGYGVNPFVVTA